MKTLGVIPARGGSKGVARKNICRVAGEPLIAYSIRAAKQSSLLTHFLTTTDDEEIASVAKRLGSPVLMRPADLAQDDTPMVPVVIHALQHAEKEAGKEYDFIVLLQPASPVRTGEDIDGAIGMMQEDDGVECVISVCEVADDHPARTYRVNDEGWMEPFWPEWEEARRQDLPVLYQRSGIIYVVRRNVLLEKKTLMSDKKKAYITSRKRRVGIDDERDLVVAEVLVRMWKEGRL